VQVEKLALSKAADQTGAEEGILSITPKRRKRRTNGGLVRVTTQENRLKSDTKETPNNEKQKEITLTKKKEKKDHRGPARYRGTQTLW